MERKILAHAVMITPYNILRHELCGLRARVVESTHPGYKAEGVVIGETRNTLTIKTVEKKVTVPKDCITLELTLPDDAVVQIEGRLLVCRPEDRIKKKHRIKF